ncbi:DNA helicase [Malaciobacter molluscorum]|uniref:DEAD/DEAH box helicase n=1 Tax=Malaciobacter molluscorum TaxID=1032072 RepID=UPI00100A9701|nr:DEAD/DEAH box helicase [Malaciobacter molluscorum]RXJ96098.1 DNA helicase [Malaciobacter molluscorum]
MEYSKRSEKQQLTKLKDSNEFTNIYYKLIREDSNISREEQEFILLSAILFFNFYDNDKRFKSFFKLAYYIILKYSKVFNDFKPLYDISIQIGFFPICNLLVNDKKIELENISSIISFNIMQSKFVNEREHYIETLEQYNSAKKLLDSNSNTLAYIAPTSFGKSSLISTFLLQKRFLKIGIIVPTKSLLIQTFKNIKKLRLDYKIILHDEMYNNQDKFIGVLTQERATRLINKGGYFDILFIDEAHKIFEYRKDNSRGLILSRLIKLNKMKNNNQKVIYLSPLIEDINNLKLSDVEIIDSYEVKYNLKCEDIFLFKNNQVNQYDRFTGKYLQPPIEKRINEFKYIKRYSKNKNFLFHYSPFKIELIANELINQDIFQDIEIDDDIQKIIYTLKNEVHEDFYINSTILKGIIYIHAKMPNIIKEYLEYQFNKIDKFKYIIANSVILEGINLPIDNLFIMSTDYQNGKDLINLIGRVNRLNYVFEEKKLNKLISDIHFVIIERYKERSNMENKIKLLREHSFTDIIFNPLMNNYDINDLKLQKTKKETKEEVIQKRQKLDEEIIEKTKYILEKNNLSLEDKIKKYFIENNIDEFYSNFNEVVNKIVKKIRRFKTHPRFKNTDLLMKIYSIFVWKIEQYISDFEIERLKNKKARNYYLNYLEKTQTLPLKNNIQSTFEYFKEKAESNDSLLFIGKTFGEIKRESPNYESNEYLQKVYVDLFKYRNDNKKLINLSIAKLKIEEDFVSFKLNKLINFLYDFELISESEYNINTYGTDDEKLINFSKMGLNVNIISKLIKDKQYANLKLDENGNFIPINDFLSYLESQPELFKFEVKKYL